MPMAVEVLDTQTNRVVLTVPTRFARNHSLLPPVKQCAMCGAKVAQADKQCGVSVCGSRKFQPLETK